MSLFRDWQSKKTGHTVPLSTTAFFPQGVTGLWALWGFVSMAHQVTQRTLDLGSHLVLLTFELMIQRLDDVRSYCSTICILHSPSFREMYLEVMSHFTASHSDFHIKLSICICAEHTVIQGHSVENSIIFRCMNVYQRQCSNSNGNRLNLELGSWVVLHLLSIPQSQRIKA